ncbi:MAG: hypothetical protein ACREVL_14855 [Solimonas sp.]
MTVTQTCGDQLLTGLSAESRLDESPPNFRVTWIAWHSGFCGSGLQVGDRIVAVQGRPVERPADGIALQRYTQGFIGQPSEHQSWAAQGLADGAPLTLTVRRHHPAGEGWQQLDVQGQLRLQRRWQDDSGRQLLSAEGPGLHDRDGQPEPWGRWLDEILPRALGVALDGIWQQAGASTRYELQELQKLGPQVAYLAEKHPGPCASAVSDDYRRALANLDAPRAPLTEADLAWRQQADTRIAEVRRLAQDAWQQALAAHAAETVAAFPAPNPLLDDPAQIVGKYLVLPPIANRDWVVEGHHNWWAARDGNGVWLCDTEHPQALQVRLAARRYQRRISPDLRAEYQLLARVLPEPRLLFASGMIFKGYTVAPVAALVGDAMFVACTADGEPPFAGEDSTQTHVTRPPDDATPRQLIEALIKAAKLGDQDGFNSLFAPWLLSTRKGQTMVFANPAPVSNDDWERTRRWLSQRVADVRVVWVDDVYLLASPDAFAGAAKIEATEVEVEHWGVFDGQTHAFMATGLNRRWPLQRIDGGPWRIARAQNI